MDEALLEKYLSNLIRIEAGMYTGDILFGENVVARYYLANWPHPQLPGVDIDAELEAFHERYIVADYYSKPGSLQWNFYLIIVAEAMDETLRHRIENDKSYTRKIVLSANELESYFDYLQGEGVQAEDIVEIWRSKLAERDLDCVFLTQVSYTAGVPNYLDGNADKAIASEDSQPPSGEGQPDSFKLKELRLESNFRPFPVKRNFDFKSVNLIRGVNGTGKTSVVEAVEFAYCGQILRNPISSSSSPGVSVLFDGHPEWQSANVENHRQPYKDRDRRWYGYASNASQRQDRIQNRFNTFNFFSSDAAFRLGASENHTIEKDLGVLVAGPDAKVLLERMDGFLRRFEDELRHDERRKNELIAQIEQCQASLSSIESSDDLLGKSFSDLRFYVLEKFNQAPFPEQHDSDFRDFDGWLTNIRIILVRIDELNIEKADPTLNVLAKVLEDVNDAIQQFEDLSSKHEGLNAAILKSGRRLEDLAKAESTLELAIKYLSEEAISSIVGLSERIRRLEAEYELIKKHNVEFEEIDWGLIRNQAPVFEALNAETIENIKIKRQEYATLREKLKKLREGLDELNSLRAEIKELGGKYIFLAPNATACPMCQTPYEFSELEGRITAIADALEISIDENDITRQLQEAEKIGKQQKALGDLLEKLGNFASRVLVGNWQLLPVSQIFTDIDGYLGKSIELAGELGNLKQLGSRFSLLGLSENGFEKIRNEVLSLRNPENPIEFELESVQNYQTSITEDLVNARSEEVILRNEIRDLKEKLDSTIELSKLGLSTNNGQNPIEILKDYRNRVGSLIELLQALASYFPGREFPFVIQVQSDLSALDVLHSTFKKQVALSKEASIYQSRLRDDLGRFQGDLDSILPKIERGKVAVSLLTDLKQNYSLEGHLRDYLENNFKRIFEIFKEIHSPKEFTRLEIHDKKIELYRKDSEQWVGLLEVSTGQRAALALAIFLSMNLSLKNGPNVLVFDDPVTFVDDLNILGFLDFLRKIAIHEDRQIIFATASEKIGNLFEHKFDFLKDSFVVHNLVRP